MTLGEQLTALADRVERETASRELDCLVEQLVSPERQVLFDPGSLINDGKRKPRPAVRGPLRDFPLTGWTDWEAIAMSIGARPYTSSIDAADAIRPEGWQVEELFAIERGKTFVCRLYRDHLTDIPEGEAAGPHAEARARLAAALRARAADVGGGGG